MAGFLWFILGFVSCFLVSLFTVALVVWGMPPARKRAEDESPSNSHESTRPRPSELSGVRQQPRKIWPDRRC